MLVHHRLAAISGQCIGECIGGGGVQSSSTIMVPQSARFCHWHFPKDTVHWISKCDDHTTISTANLTAFPLSHLSYHIVWTPILPPPLCTKPASLDLRFPCPVFTALISFHC
mmetsp:Transcript_57005/g.92233  ORF Transcript_57005/g.92233 Transcript_57005/m.92233 type:complete len:112 (-) Transcript_57005:191-526(-)